MIIYLYVTILILTFLHLAFFVCVRKRPNAILVIFLALIFLSTLGYSAVAIALNVDAAIFGLDLSILCNCYLPLFGLRLSSDLMNIRIPKRIMYPLGAFSAFVAGAGFTAGYSDLFYRTISLETASWGNYLIKEYGPLHICYHIMLFGYLAVYAGFLVYAWNKRTRTSFSILLAYFLLFLFVVIIYLIERLAHWDVELVPVSYIPVEAGIIIFNNRADLYDVTEDVRAAWERMEEYAYIILDRKRNYVGSNDLAKAYFPFLKDQYIDCPLGYAGRDRRVEVNPIISAALDDADALDRGEVPAARSIRLKDLWIRADIRYLYKVFREPVGYVLEFYDETKERGYLRSIEERNERLTTAEAEARSANEAKDRFLAAMSHEIRTPINTIMGMNELIGRETTEAAILSYSDSIGNAGHLLLSLVNDILDFSKIQAGRLEINLSDYRPVDLVRDVCELTRVGAEEKGLSFTVDFNDNLPAVLRGDDVRIRQILVNLLSNAVKYTKTGEVTLSVEAEERTGGSLSATVPGEIVRQVDRENAGADEEKKAVNEAKAGGCPVMDLIISVKDTGIGIHRRDQQRIFESFKRLDAAETHHIEGTGLGLAITKELVDAMDGTIGVESVYGLGSVFTVRLPQEVVDPSPSGPLEAAGKGPDSRGLRKTILAPEAQILVADDNPANLAVFTGLLKRTKIRIDTAEGGAEAIALASVKKYDCIFLDHMMPDPDGLAALREIREDESGRNRATPAVALTANAVAGAERFYREKGFAAYVSKPVDPQAREQTLIDLLPPELVTLQVFNEGRGNLSAVSEGGVSRIFNRVIAMKYCGNDPDTFRAALTRFTDIGYDYLKDLPLLLEKGDLKDYERIVHAIKSTAMTVGAEDLSGQAKEQENLAGAEDLAGVRSTAEDFLQAFRQVLDTGRGLLKEIGGMSGYERVGAPAGGTAASFAGNPKAFAGRPAAGGGEDRPEEKRSKAVVSKGDFLDMAWETRHLLEIGDVGGAKKKLSALTRVTAEGLPEDLEKQLDSVARAIAAGNPASAAEILKSLGG